MKYAPFAIQSFEDGSMVYLQRGEEVECGAWWRAVTLRYGLTSPTAAAAVGVSSRTLEGWRQRRSIAHRHRPQLAAALVELEERRTTERARTETTHWGKGGSHE